MALFSMKTDRCLISINRHILREQLKNGARFVEEAEKGEEVRCSSFWLPGKKTWKPAWMAISQSRSSRRNCAGCG